MKKIAVFTGTRAEYGLLFWLLKAIDAESELRLQLVVSAMHLSPEFGFTKTQIEQDGFTIDEEVEMLLSSDSEVGCAKSVGLGIIGFADSIRRLAPDAIVVLGDRFEALAMAQTAMLMNTPVVHLHGGEITEGAKDDAIRHAITKLSSLHFTSNKRYMQRVIQLGENPNRVFNVGAIGLEGILRNKQSLRNSSIRRKLADSLSLSLEDDYFLLTYHSATLTDEDPAKSIEAILSALEEFPSYKVIITYPNADDGGRTIINYLEHYAAKNTKRIRLVQSLGVELFHTAVAHATAVLGNSSSGIIEVPAFNVASINIGARQKGRLTAESVLHCDVNVDSIVNALNEIVNGNVSLDCANPYEALDAAKYCSEIIVDKLKTTRLTTQKTFYDLSDNSFVNGETN